MRPEPDFQARVSVATMVAPPSYSAVPHSVWRTPVPYLFGGLAALLGLISFALLILACSYWKLFSYLEEDAADHPPAGNGGEKPACSIKLPSSLYEEGTVVIMAGDDKPTFLATPIASRSAFFTGKDNSAASEDGDKKLHPTH